MKMEKIRGVTVFLLLIGRIIREWEVRVLNNILKLRSADNYSSWRNQTPQSKKKVVRFSTARSVRLIPSNGNMTPLNQSRKSISRGSSVSSSSRSQISTPASQFRAPNSVIAPNSSRLSAISTPRSDSSAQVYNTNPLTSSKASDFLRARQNSIENLPTLSKFGHPKPYSSFKPVKKFSSPLINNHNMYTNQHNLDESFDSEENK